ncbi:MAG: T9SS type A sorting domain-containing protein [Bacteroidetes bacterium]|nr:T9SS type A sorting domain-containing protein [Bacteroidota bacterium]
MDASTVNYTINQTQLDPPFFTMPVELLFNFSDGSDTLITIFNNVNNQNFNFHFSKIVTAVTFDPENKIVLKEFSYTSPINTPDIPLNVSIFPNPSDNNFNISFTLDKPETVTLKLLNMQGEMVYTNRQGIINTGHHTISLQTEGLNAGTYLLLITTESAANSYIIIKN